MVEAVINPKIMRNVCMNAHPQGCEKLVESQIEYVKTEGKLQDGPRNVLIIGGSAGYGLASRISAAYGYGARTLNVAYEVPAIEAKKRPASVGWYNSMAFEKRATQDGLWCKSIFGDAFSDEIKHNAIKMIKDELGTVDLVVYSLASGRRVDPKTGETYTSVLKPIGNPFVGDTIDVVTGQIMNITIDPATEEECAHTIKVMGGEDWKLWMRALQDEGVLAENSTSVAFSYIGPAVTAPLYRKGTIGKAKEDLERTAHEIDIAMQSAGLGRAYVSVNKALVTRASMVIPVVPLYLSTLYKVMKEKGIHEVCIQQMYRMCRDKIYNGKGVVTDASQLIRLDDWEMRDDVQQEVEDIWKNLNTDNLGARTDFASLKKEFYQLHGFEWDSVDYTLPVEL